MHGHAGWASTSTARSRWPTPSRGAPDARDGPAEEASHPDGQPGHGPPRLPPGVELIRSGLLGPIREVHVWTNRPFKYWKQAPDIVARPETTPGPAARPLGPVRSGPAPAARTTRSITRTTGAAGGTSAPARWATWPATPRTWPSWRLKLGLPDRRSRPRAARSTPRPIPPGRTITYEFPARGDLPPVTLTWYEGKKDGQRVLPPEPLVSKLLKPGEKLPTAARSSSATRDRSSARTTTGPLPPDSGEELRGPQQTKPEKLPEGRPRQGGRRAPEEGVGRRHQGGQASAGVLELRLRRPADRGDAARQHRSPVSGREAGVGRGQPQVQELGEGDPPFPSSTARVGTSWASGEVLSQARHTLEEPAMLTRRNFLASAGAALLARPSLAAEPVPAKKLRLAVVTKIWTLPAATPGTWASGSSSAIRSTGTGTSRRSTSSPPTSIRRPRTT